MPVSDIRIVEVPTHWPPADWPQVQGAQVQGPLVQGPLVQGPLVQGPQAGTVQHQGGQPDPGPVRVADPADGGQAWPRQFAVLLAETLAGVRPVRQLLPLFADGHRPHIARVLTARPAEDVIEMTLIVTVGPRTRALAVRLERTCPSPPPAWSEKLASPATRPRSAASARWLCTDIEAA
jgi:Family of unknown function (DUF6459)